MDAEEWDLRNMSENTLKAKVLEIGKANGWCVYHVPQGRIKSAGDHGFPDLTFARDREVVFIELKREHTTLEPAQIMWREALPAYHVVRPSDLEAGRVHELLA